MAEKDMREKVEVSNEGSEEQIPNTEETEAVGDEESSAAPGTPQPPQDVAKAKQSESSDKAQADAAKLKKPNKRLVAIVAAVTAIVIFVAIAAGVSCSGPSYKLDKDESIRTEWGTTVQFKIDKNWETNSTSNQNNEWSVHESYFGPADSSDRAYVFIDLENTGHRIYKYDSTATYSDWLESNKDFFDRHATSENGVTQENYSMDELGTIKVDGNEFRLYKQHYTLSYDDAAYAKAKEKNPDAKQNTDLNTYYALIKDGKHDMEVTANTEKLLKDLLGTMKISW